MGEAVRVRCLGVPKAWCPLLEDKWMELRHGERENHGRGATTQW